MKRYLMKFYKIIKSSFSGTAPLRGSVLFFLFLQVNFLTGQSNSCDSLIFEQLIDAGDRANSFEEKFDKYELAASEGIYCTEQQRKFAIQKQRAILRQLDEVARDAEKTATKEKAARLELQQLYNKQYAFLEAINVKDGYTYFLEEGKRNLENGLPNEAVFNLSVARLFGENQEDSISLLISLARKLSFADSLLQTDRVVDAAPIYEEILEVRPEFVYLKDQLNTVLNIESLIGKGLYEESIDTATRYQTPDGLSFLPYVLIEAPALSEITLYKKNIDQIPALLFELKKIKKVTLFGYEIDEDLFSQLARLNSLNQVAFHKCRFKNIDLKQKSDVDFIVIDPVFSSVPFFCKNIDQHNFRLSFMDSLPTGEAPLRLYNPPSSYYDTIGYWKGLLGDYVEVSPEIRRLIPKPSRDSNERRGDWRNSQANFLITEVDVQNTTTRYGQNHFIKPDISSDLSFNGRLKSINRKVCDFPPIFPNYTAQSLDNVQRKSSISDPSLKEIQSDSLRITGYSWPSPIYWKDIYYNVNHLYDYVNLNSVSLSFTNDWNSDFLFPIDLTYFNKLKTVRIDKYNANLLVSSRIFPLSNLDTLIIKNAAKTTISEEIEMAKNMKFLDLGYGGTEDLPECIFTLPNLNYLRANARLFQNLPKAFLYDTSLIDLAIVVDEDILIDWEAITSNKAINHIEFIGDTDSYSGRLLGIRRKPSLETSFEGTSDNSTLDALLMSRIDLSREKKLLSSLSRLVKLEHLELVDCNLKSLPEFIMKLDNLTDLRLSENRLRKISLDLNQLVNVRSVSLKSNRLKSLNIIASNQTESIRQLDISNNRIKSLPLDEFLSTGLHWFSLSKNRISSFNLPQGEYNKLEHLDLSYNCIETVPLSITNISGLTHLNLEGNFLKEIDVDILGLPSLKQINITNNYLDDSLAAINQICRERDIECIGCTSRDQKFLSIISFIKIKKLLRQIF